MKDDKPQWAPLGRPRDEDGTKQLPVVAREALLKESEPATGLLSEVEIKRLRQQSVVPDKPALDPLDQDLPAVSPVQAPREIPGVQKLPPPAPTEPAPLMTELLTPTEIRAMKMQDELGHGARHALPVLASRFPPKESSVAVKGTGFSVDRPQQDVQMFVLSDVKQEPAPQAARRAPAATPPVTTQALTRREWAIILIATICGMCVMALWLGWCR
jgi:hypothetical protein